MRKRRWTHRLTGLLLVLWGAIAAAQPKYDLLLKGGHVLDAKNHIDDVRDVAIAGRKIAAVAQNIPASAAVKVVDVSSLYVTPGLVDIHTHVLTMSGLRGSLAEDQNVWADSHTLRAGVTTVVDAGCSGWRNFPEQKARILDHSRTRILAMLNIVGHGQGGGALERRIRPTWIQSRQLDVAKRPYPGVVVGIKTAHYRGPELDTGADRPWKRGPLPTFP